MSRRANPKLVGAFVLAAIALLVGAALVFGSFGDMLIVGLFAFPGLHVTATGWLTLVWVAALGLLATIPLGIPSVPVTARTG